MEIDGLTGFTPASVLYLWHGYLGMLMNGTISVAYHDRPAASRQRPTRPDLHAIQA